MLSLASISTALPTPPSETGTLPQSDASTTPTSGESDTTGTPTPEPLPRASTNNGYTLSYLSISPSKYTWGQKVQIGLSVTLNGKPVKSAPIRFWFSGQYHSSTSSWGCTTGADRRAYSTIPLPNDKITYKWLDLNATVDKYGLSIDPLPRIIG